MRAIKFRQRISGGFHYWGFGKDVFTAPCQTLNTNQFESAHDQFTGLTDKNGVEIYEGDVLLVYEYEGYVPTEKDRCFVKWNDGYAGFTCASVMNDVGEIATCEIIGNIYGNPELL